MGRGARRYVRPGIDAAVWISSGRWGPKRVQVTQCLAVLKAEDSYTELLRGDFATVQPGRRGWLDWTVQSDEGQATFRVQFEIRANAVWRFGRVFCRCPAHAAR